MWRRKQRDRMDDLQWLLKILVFSIPVSLSEGFIIHLIGLLRDFAVFVEKPDYFGVVTRQTSGLVDIMEVVKKTK